MKKFVIITLSCFIIGLMLIPELATAKIEKSRQGIRNAKEHSSNTESPDDKNIDPNAVAKTENTNRPARSKIKPGSIENVKRERARAMSRWLHSNVEDRAGLALTVQDQAIAELMYVRQQAVKDGAAKTIKAIDLLISLRKDDYDKIGKMISVELKKKKRAEREERKKTRMEFMKARGRSLKAMPRDIRGRHQRKPVDPNNLENQKQGAEQ